MEKATTEVQAHSRGRVQEVLPKVAGELGKVCALAKGVF